MTNVHKDRIRKEWTSPIYAFFETIPAIEHIGTRRSHVFSCASRGCKVTVRRYLDTKDARSTGNMRKHAKKCWGDDAVSAADDAKDATEARTKVVAGILKNGKITTAFERKNKNKPTYSNIPYTHLEIRYALLYLLGSV